MAGSLKTEGIVLRSMRYGEADRILHLYTPHRGRVSAIAKGVRRAKSRFGGRLEPFFRLQLVLYEGKQRPPDGHERRDDGRPPAPAGGRPRRSTPPPAPATRSRACSTTATRTRASTTCSPTSSRCSTREPDRAGRANALAFRLKLLLAAGFAPQLAACASCGEREHLAGLLRRRRRRGLHAPARRARSGSTRRPTTSSSLRSAVRSLTRPTPRRARSPRRSGRSSTPRAPRARAAGGPSA